MIQSNQIESSNEVPNRLKLLLNLKSILNGHKYIYIAVITLIITQSCGKQYEKESLVLKLHSNKEIYQKGEPIWLTIVYGNISEDVIIVNFSLSDGSRHAENIHLSDKDGNNFKFKGIFSYSPPTVTKIQPGEEIKSYVQLLNSFGEFYYYNIAYSCPMYLKPNEYNVFNTLHRDNEKSINSNVLKICVEEPHNIEANAHSNLLKFFSRDKAKIPDYNHKYEQALNFLRQYPTSAYYDMVFYYFMTFRLNNGMKLDSYVDDCNSFVKKSPSSPYLEEIIGSTISALERTNKENDIYAFLLNIKDNYVNTFASSIAAKYLQNISYKEMKK